MSKVQRHRSLNQMDPKKLIKATREPVVTGPSFKPTGERERTEAGFKVEGYVGKGFETRFESVIGGYSSAAYSHPTKTRSVWVIEGQGVAVIVKGEETEEVKLELGTRVDFGPETTYRICAVGQDLSLIVVQDSKYEQRLEIVAQPERIALVPEDLVSASYFPVTKRTLSGSKAAQQLADQMNGVEARRQVIQERPAAFHEGINPAPSLEHITEGTL